VSLKCFTEVPEVSLCLTPTKKGFGCMKEDFGCLKEKQQFCALTPNPELLGGLRSQLSVVFFPQGHGCF